MLKQTIQKAKNFLQHRHERLFWEEKKYPGLSPKFYIIRRRDSNVGLFSYYITFLGAIRKAVDAGYIPVIDMMSYQNTYLAKEQVGKENAWESFFEQPCGYDLSDARFHQKFIDSGNVDYPYPPISLKPGSQKYQEWKVFADRYIRIAPQVECAIEEAYQQIVPQGKRALGVLCRGTDYVKLRPHRHPVQPTAEMMIQKVKECLQEWDCEYIYLATEDSEICEKFKREFGHKLLYRAQDKIDYNKNTYLSQYLPSDTAGKIKKGQDYLISIGVLTKCNALIAGRTSGTIGALLLPNRFEKIYLWDLGVYE